jgi:hypothetical protein
MIPMGMVQSGKGMEWRGGEERSKNKVSDHCGVKKSKKILRAGALSSRRVLATVRGVV